MKQVVSRHGQIVVDEVPAPAVDDFGILVDVAYSVVSTGTEVTGVKHAKQSIVQKGLRDPKKAIKVLNSFRKRGLRSTLSLIEGQVAGGASTLGYSCSGIVVGVGPRVRGISVGDRVACAGAGKANHAEMVLVPQNLVVKVPEGCDLQSAASVAIGAIALQGVRRADARIGETVAVIGLGLVGQLTCQILHAAGCRVLGVDVDEKRIIHARTLGLEWGALASSPDLKERVLERTGGHGADAVIITASAPGNNGIVAQALDLARRKGKVVVVGEVGLGLQRAGLYQKELDFLISTSYGPGRYDPVYEERGLDYPFAWVRWTEQRNMAAYLDLLAQKKVSFSGLLPRLYPVEQASEAYQALQTPGDKPLAVVIDYHLEDGNRVHRNGKAHSLELKPVQKKSGALSIAVIGAGGFAKGTILPNLQKLSELYTITAIVSASGMNARDTARQFGAVYCATDYREVLADDRIDAVFIATRHNQHAHMAVDAASAGKAVFLEKPVATTEAELDELMDVLRQRGTPFMVGFNRRFSPAAVRLRQVTETRTDPLVVLYRVNGGLVPLDHWIQTEEGGGRIIGEACHMLDLFSFLTGDTEIESIAASAIVPRTEKLTRQDNFTASLRYSDGSMCTLVYTAIGNTQVPKEYVEAHFDGKSAVIDDFKSLRFYGVDDPGWKGMAPDKGHLRLLEVFARVARGEEQSPLPLEALEQTTRASIIIDQAVRES